MTNVSQPPQLHLPDDIVPSRDGYDNNQLAIRKLAEVAAQLVMHGSMPDMARRAMLATVTEAIVLTEPRD